MAIWTPHSGLSLLDCGNPEGNGLSRRKQPRQRPSHGTRWPRIADRINGGNLEAIVLATLLLGYSLPAAEYHFSPSGNNTNNGTSQQPFRTISRAGELAQPGDVITVHAGVYRERINPPRGGVSDHKRIVYQAASGEKVEIKGSEIVTNWVKAQGRWLVSPACRRQFVAQRSGAQTGGNGPARQSEGAGLCL